MLQRLQELIFAVKDKLSDGEYLEIMNELKEVHERIEELEEAPFEADISEIPSDSESEMSEDSNPEESNSEESNAEDSDSEESNAEDSDSEPKEISNNEEERRGILLKEQFIEEVINTFPLIHWALVLDRIIEDDFTLPSSYALTFEKKIGEYDEVKVKSYLLIMFKLFDKMISKEAKIYYTVELYNFLFQNYSFTQNHPSLFEIVTRKLEEHEKDFRPVPLFDENPFTKWRALI